MGGVRESRDSTASLCQVRSSVLGLLESVPRRVITPGEEWRVKVWLAIHLSSAGALGERAHPSGDHVRECMLKSPRSMVGTVGSKSRDVRVLKEVGSSTLW